MPEDQPSRRQVLHSLAATVPLAAILADSRLVRAAAESLETVSITTAGGAPVIAALALPATVPAPAVLLIHEWWGLNDQIKAMAGECARNGYVALAVDLYGGESTSTREQAQALMQAVNPMTATDTLVSWAQWLRQHPKATGKLGTIG